MFYIQGEGAIPSPFFWLSSQKMWFEKNYKTKLKVFKLAIARHYILMHFSIFSCKLLLNEELAIITFSLVNYLWRVV